MVAHVGVVTGALFGVLCRRLRLSVPALPRGVINGSLVWLVSDRGWVSALGAVLRALVGRRPRHQHRTTMCSASGEETEIMAIRGMLVDVDDTLMRGNDVQARAWVEVCTAYGRDVPVETVRPLIGIGGDKVVPELDLLMASSARAADLEMRLNAVRIDDLLLERAAMGDAGGIQAGARQRGRRPREERRITSKAIMIGDSPSDIASAAQSGVGTIARCGGRFSDEDLTGAWAIDDGLGDLCAWYDTSPVRGASCPAGAAVRGAAPDRREEGEV